MAQLLRALSALTEDEASIPRTPWQHQLSVTSIPGIQDFFLASMGTRQTCSVHIQAGT